MHLLSLFSIQVHLLFVCIIILMIEVVLVYLLGFCFRSGIVGLFFRLLRFYGVSRRISALFSRAIVIVNYFFYRDH